MFRPLAVLALLSLAGCREDEILVQAEKDRVAAQSGDRAEAPPAKGALSRVVRKSDSTDLPAGAGPQAGPATPRPAAEAAAGSGGGSAPPAVGGTPPAVPTPAEVPHTVIQRGTGVPDAPAPGKPSGPAVVPPAPDAGRGAAPRPGVPVPPKPGNPLVPPPGGALGAPKAGGSRGVVGGVRVTGTVTYAAWTRGDVRLAAFDSDHALRSGTPPRVLAFATVSRPGPFVLELPRNAGPVYVEASVDLDGDGKPGPLDPQGRADRFPVSVGTVPVEGLRIELRRAAPPPEAGRR
ncbi:MAG: hypothetical protein RLZZ299_2809 [Pseudomonadota bacterium]|jgi:translation initiation factor IF-2